MCLTRHELKRNHIYPNVMRSPCHDKQFYFNIQYLSETHRVSHRGTSLINTYSLFTI